MTNPPRILIVDDNPDFGGHQVMTAHGIEGMLLHGSWEICGLLHPDNTKNQTRWSTIIENHGDTRVRCEDAPTRTTKFQAVRRLWQKEPLDRLQKLVRDYAPDLILVIQGNIEQCCSTFRLKGRVDCPIISYIPVPQKHAEMGAKLGHLRDWTCRGLYAEPDGFITISKTLGDTLLAYGAKGRIQIVENGIPLEAFKEMPDQATARKQLNLPQDRFIWGQIGRTEFKQKGQDFSLSIFTQRAATNPEEGLAFLGSGPDSETLAKQIKPGSAVFNLPWTDNTTPFYAAIDALLLPSRYEGVPLAMLEALANGIPVAATDRDGMRDWLPQEWRFDYRDMATALKATDAVRSADPAIVDSLKKRVWESHSLDCFQRAFNTALEEWV